MINSKEKIHFIETCNFGMDKIETDVHATEMRIYIQNMRNCRILHNLLKKNDIVLFICVSYKISILNKF